MACFRHDDKSSYGLPRLIHHIQVGAHHNKLFSNKIFPYIQFYKLLGLWLYFDFFLTLGLYYIALKYRYINTYSLTGSILPKENIFAV